MSDFVLVVQNLCKRYANQTVIDQLSFTIKRGECLAIFAPSGAGKTTLVKILSGLETSDGGQYWIFDDAPVTVFQETRLFPFMTVEENIFLPFTAQGKKITSPVRENYQHWIRVCELEAVQQCYPCQLSGGMKQKTALIRALLPQPRFAMLDEPFQSIGIHAREKLIQHIRAVCPQLSLLLITHSPDEVRQLAQCALVFEQSCLAQGRQVVQPGSPGSAFLPKSLTGEFLFPDRKNHQEMIVKTFTGYQKEIP